MRAFADFGTPLLIGEGFVLVGFREDAWAEKLH